MQVLVKVSVCLVVFLNKNVWSDGYSYQECVKHVGSSQDCKWSNATGARKYRKRGHCITGTSSQPLVQPTKNRKANKGLYGACTTVVAKRWSEFDLMCCHSRYFQRSRHRNRFIKWSKRQPHTLRAHTVIWRKGTPDHSSGWSRLRLGERKALESG
jgi:hypothetical protein